MVRVLIACLVLAVAAPVAAAPGSGTASAKYERAFRKGNELFGRGDWAGAREAYEQAYAIDPKPVLLFNIASTYRREGDLVSARRYYKRYLAADPEGQQASLAALTVDEIDNTLAPPERAPAPETPAPTPPLPAPERYPMTVLDRPLTLPRGMIGGISRIRVFPHYVVVSAVTRVRYDYFAELGAEAGVTDWLELEANGYLNLTDTHRSLAGITASVRLADGQVKARVSANLQYGFELNRADSLALGALAQVRLTDRIALRTADSPLLFVFTPRYEIFLRIPVGIAFQILPRLYAAIDTRIASIELTQPKPRFIGSDYHYVSTAVSVAVSRVLDIAIGLRLLDLDAVDASITLRARL